MNKRNAVSIDQAARNSIKPKELEYFSYAVEQSKRKRLDLVREVMRLQRGRGKLPLHEYVRYRVFENDRLSPEDQSRFITNALCWPITYKVCDMTWQATTEDKWLCAHILKSSGIRVPETLAVIDRSGRNYLGTRKISTTDDFKSFLKEQRGQPVFAKVNRGICAYGALLIDEVEDDRLRLRRQDWIDFQTCFEDLIGDTPYILQPVERNHAFFDELTDNLATVRVCILQEDGKVSIPFCVLKLPGGENFVDSFWRQDNMACAVNPETGVIETARTKNAVSTVDHAVHPETGAALLGETLPMWSALLDLVHTCSPIFSPVSYQSMDIALTASGPVLIEINTSGGFDLPQLATGQGFLTDEVLEFFKSHGYSEL